MGSTMQTQDGAVVCETSPRFCDASWLSCVSLPSEAGLWLIFIQTQPDPVFVVVQLSLLEHSRTFGK